MSRNLKPLEKRRLIKVSDAQKGRTRHVEITKAGEEAIRKAVPHWKAAQKDFRELIGDDDMNQLILILDRVYSAVNSK